MRKTNWLGLFLFAFLLLVPVRAWSVGWTPTDAGLVVDFQTTERFLLSVWIDADTDGVEDPGEEYFVCDYPSHKDGRFKYTTGDFLKLIPLQAGDTTYPAGSVWTIGDKLTHSDKVKGEEPNFKLDGICYTMWGENNNTLKGDDTYKILGNLAPSNKNTNLCDVAFVVPTNNERTTSFDPENTLGRVAKKGDKFNGRLGYNSDLKLYYREVYWLAVTRKNQPISYANAALITFNTTTRPQEWYKKTLTIAPGRSAYAYADHSNDKPHHLTPRTIFRLYPLDKPVSSCSSYFFGWDEQDSVRYRDNNNNSDPHYTSWRKIFTMDHFECMEHETKPDLSFYRTEGMHVPSSDRTYFYVGYNNTYLENAAACTESGSPTTFISVFKPIDSLRVRGLREETKVYKPSKNAFGYMAIDTTSTKDNLGVAFEPAGYFLKVSTGTNVKMVPNANRTIWTCEQMWTITDEWSELSIKATLMTGPEFSETDEGADIEDWSEMVVGNTIKVKDTEVPCTGKSGWAQIDVTNPEKNGGMVFIEADSTLYIRYNYNGHFGNPIPNLHPELGKTKVAVQAPRLLGDYEFICWTNVPDTTGLTAGVGFHKYYAGDSIDLKDIPKVADKKVLVLYAQARYKGAINVAISFLKDDGKRYFLTHPTGVPRFARARYYEDWTNVRQGIGNTDNTDPNYLSSYKIIGREEGCKECEPSEYVLDPRHETMKGAVDSLVYYEDSQPDGEEYLGLYYTDPNTILANTTWAGLFTSTGSWPTPANPCVNNTKISSTHYLKRDPADDDKIKRYERSNHDKPNVKYVSATDQFDGISGTGTDFMISGVGVVDEHYVILPDATDATTPWTDEITFDYHKDESTMQQVWSKLIGKQLLAQMKVGDDTIYFHPNPKKTITNANELRLSRDYRLTHAFEYIHDKRAAGLIAKGDSAYMEETENDFCCNIYSGASSPRDVVVGGKHIDIVDTLRVWLRPNRLSKIKDYYGRWKDAAVDSVLPDGSRYRDIKVITKTYYYTPTQTRLVCEPEFPSYSFSPLNGQSQDLNFTLLRQTYRQLFDADDKFVREEITRTDTLELDLTSATCTFSSATPSTYFDIDSQTGSRIVLKTILYNKESGDNLDTLHINYSKGDTTVMVPVPLKQVVISTEELIWSVKDGSNRYFIMAGTGGLIYRKFTQVSLTLYQEGTKNPLIKGSANSENNDSRYITPWAFGYDPVKSTITLTTGDPVARHFAIDGVPGVDAGKATELTFELVRSYTNDFGNYEEQVYLRYGANQWLRFKDGALTLTDPDKKGDASLFSWSYLLDEYNIQNNGTYPNLSSVDFGYNSGSSVTVKTAYKAYHEYSMLLDNKKVYVCRRDESTLANLINSSLEWKTTYTVDTIRDRRNFDGTPDPTSGLTKTPAGESTFNSTVTPSGTSPTNVRIDGKYVNIVDTLVVTVGLQEGGPAYQFKGDWTSFSSLSDACLKIPLTRKTYHDAPYDSVVCMVENDEYNFAFPSTLRAGYSEDSLHTFTLKTIRRTGTNTLDADGHAVKYVPNSNQDLTETMDLDNPEKAEIRIVDGSGKRPDWCEISALGDNTVTVRCKSNGIRSPRSASLYFAYIVTHKDGEDKDVVRYANFKLTVSQASLFQYANNQHLVHSPGASGDPLMEDGRQQTHENKRILYYYNPEPYNVADQNVELPIRERGFYGWWRWYREGKDENGDDVSDMDVPDSLWIAPPRNVGTGNNYNYPFRIIGDSVKVPNPNYGKVEGEPDSIKQLVTMGRYTVFHYPSREYKTKIDPPSKSPLVFPPREEKTVTYVVDLSNYIDNLPLSTKVMNQVDTAVLDTMQKIIEPTLSLREVFELHPWTEMAEIMEGFKDTIDGGRNLKYMEDHEVMAPINHRLLLRTEQRYNYENLAMNPYNHSESLLGYYMRDDNWNKEDGYWRFDNEAARKACQDTMIWCGGWDADCKWYVFHPEDSTYTACEHELIKSDDFLDVPEKKSISGDADTVIYCLRARSWKTENPAVNKSDSGDYWFNICRYTIIYHNESKFGPIVENTKNGVTKALITNDEIEQNYEVLERLNFDYIKPGKDYHVYPHPLPWADGSYGYSYPVRPDIPDNRYHNDFAPNFAGVGEYGIINRIPYANYWHKMEQHGGAENGYMIYCDGMNSSGQVAALSLETKLCEGQKMYFSGYVGNPSNQNGKANPNFTFTVQGSADGEVWKDITTYMTGDIKPSQKWYQIFFPISHRNATYDHFRVRIYNMASDYDGNDFIIDDLCIFATKPPLIAYQANTQCVEEGENDSITHIVLRVDYQGFVDTFTYNKRAVYYTVHKNDSSFVEMLDGYYNEVTKKGQVDPATPDTIYGYITMPAHTYEPVDKDSIFINLADFVHKFDTTFAKGRDKKFNKGYLYENLDGVVRPVLYVIHQAKMTADNDYKVRLATGEEGLMNSKCAMTSNLKVSNRMVLMLNDEENEDPNVTNMCANSTYDLSVRVKGSMFLDSVAPFDFNGSCVNDWLLYGDTSDVTSVRRYGYKYSDIVNVVKEILRFEPTSGTNVNQFARSLEEVNKNVMKRIQTDRRITFTTEGHEEDHPYDILDSLVSKGFLTLYQSKLTATVSMGDSLKYVIFPIVGTGSEAMDKKKMEVCPTPLIIKLKPNKGGAVPLMVGGIQRDSTQLSSPVVMLVNERTANSQMTLRIDSIKFDAVIHSISLISTNDSDFYQGVHMLNLTPDKIYNFGGDNSDYYTKGSDILMRPSSSNNYEMRQGYSYTFGIVMQTRTGALDGDDGCAVGTVPFTVSVVPDYLRWDPKNRQNNQWNNPENWIGVDANNVPLPNNPRFAPLVSTDVIIPPMPDSLPYPNLPGSITAKDSVKQINFVYNTCDDIRFLAGSALGQQQRLTCDVVVVDMTMPHNKWALRSAPITGMISGDLFMADADLSGETKMWSVGEFDAAGRTNTTGNAAFYPSVYSNTVIRYGNGGSIKNDTLTNEGWSKVTNALTLSLPPAQGWAVYTRTKSGKAAEVRLPKSDDRFYFYYANGDRAEDSYEDNLRTLRTTNATSAGADAAGKLAYRESDQTFTLTKASDANATFVFGNPSMGYIDIWGFIADNSLVGEIRYIDKDGIWRTVTSETTGTDTITNLARYLPPMHAIVVKAGSAGTSKNVTLNSNRIVTHPRQKVRAGAPRHVSASGRSKGIMTVTATNAASSRCTTRLLLGQGYSDEIRKGEDAILTTVNIDKYSNTSYPATPFNIYAVEEGYGLSIDLLDEILNVPVSFYMSKLSFNPITKLWFTGVNSIDGQLVLYDAQTDTERLIIDGTCLEIETPTNSHEVRYYIRRHGYRPGTTTDPIATQFESLDSSEEQAMKYIQNGVVYILRNGHVYTLFGQKIQ